MINIPAMVLVLNSAKKPEPVVHTKCLHCLDNPARPDGYCSTWCADVAELATMGVTKLSRERKPEPSREVSAQVAASVVDFEVPSPEIVDFLSPTRGRC